MTAEEFNKFNFSHLFYGIAIAIIMVIQAWHSSELSDVKQDMIPRTEYERKHVALRDITKDKDEIEEDFRSLRHRLNKLMPRAEYEIEYDALEDVTKEDMAELQELKKQVTRLERQQYSRDHIKPKKSTNTGAKDANNQR